MPLNGQDKDNILKSILLGGSSSSDTAEINHIIADKSKAPISNSSGTARIRKPFKLILSQPQAVQAFNPFEIRCCLCQRVISYPCWYHKEEYNVNNIHYFICFDSSSPERVTARCFRR